MYLQKTYENICGHTALGPITLHTHQIRDTPSDLSYHTTTHYKASLHLPIPCPFCSGILDHLNHTRYQYQSINQEYQTHQSNQEYQSNQSNQSTQTLPPPQTSPKETSPGSGLLCILLPHPHPPTPFQEPTWYWAPLKSTPLSALTPTDWNAPFIPSSDPSLPQLYTYDTAWIPKPCGEVRITDRSRPVQVQQPGPVGMVLEPGTVDMVLERGVERNVITEVTTSRKEKMSLLEVMSRGGVGESRMAGLISQLRAAVWSGERAGRYS